MVVKWPLMPHQGHIANAFTKFWMSCTEKLDFPFTACMAIHEFEAGQLPGVIAILFLFCVQAVHFPGEIQPCPVTTENGMRAIRKFACANHLDFVTVSYCQAADDARYALMLQACNW